MTRLSIGLRVLGLAAVLMVPAGYSAAEESNQFGIEPSKSFSGLLLSRLSAEWWQWVFSLHGGAGENPVQDTNGSQCMVGQSGPVWRLAGNFTGQPSVVRSCSVPADRALFFPVINSVFTNSPGTCGQDSTNVSVEQARKIAAGPINAVTNLALQLDGHDISDIVRRVRSQVFSVALGADNIDTSFGIPCAAGVYSTSVDDGYYAFLPPLKLGGHTLHIYAAGPFTVDVTYRLTVIR